MSFRQKNENGWVMIIGLIILLLMGIGSIWYESYNPCLERGPREISRIDPETGYVYYHQRCLKRTH